MKKGERTTGSKVEQLNSNVFKKKSDTIPSRKEEEKVDFAKNRFKDGRDESKIVFLFFVTLRTVKKFFLPHAADQMETERPVRGVAFGKSFDVAHLDAEYKGENNTEDESFGHAQHGVHSCRVKKKRKIVTNKIKKNRFIVYHVRPTLLHVDCGDGRRKTRNVIRVIH